MMPWKLLAFIAVMAVVLVFVGFNLDNRCDISVIFVTFQAVPVVITILTAYLLGLLSAFFLAVGRGGRIRGKGASRSKMAAQAETPSLQSIAEGEAQAEPPRKARRGKPSQRP